MSVVEPLYYGSWKGRVLEAIAVENIRDWNGILEYTQLTPEALDIAISELQDLKVITRQEDDLYWINNIDIYRQYRTYFENLQADKTPLIQHKETDKIIFENALPKDEDIAKWVVKWREFKNLSFSLDARHFFLEGTYLDDLSKDLLRQAKKEVLVVNPYIEQCHLSNALIDPITNKAQVIVITRPILDSNKEVKDEKVTYHEYLKKEGIQLHYDRRIHAKLLVVDQQIAVISSMNFYSSSTGGSSWEAGMISIDEAIVNSVHKTIQQLLTKLK